MKIDGPGRWRTSLVAWLHRIALQHPLQRATFHFIGQTFTRSSKHRLFLAAYGGFAIAFAILILFPVVTVDGVPRIQVSASGLVAFPLILSFCLLTAFRAAFSFPAELSPNWVFQVADAEAFAEHLAASRKWVTLMGILPLFAALAPWAFFVWPWNLALFYLSFGIILSLLLLELLFFQFRKIPFACSYFPGKINAALLAGLYLYGLTTYSFTMTDLAQWTLQRPLRVILFYGICAAALYASHLHRNWQAGGMVLTFEDEPDPVVRTLGIG